LLTDIKYKNLKQSPHDQHDNDQYVIIYEKEAV